MVYEFQKTSNIDIHQTCSSEEHLFLIGPTWISTENLSVGDSSSLLLYTHSFMGNLGGLKLTP